MKKYITGAAMLVAAAALANGADTEEAPKVESGSYTLKMDNWTLGDDSLYNFLYGAINEGGTLVFDLGIDYTGTNCGQYQALLHVGAFDTGFSIYANGGPHVIVTSKHDTSSDHELMNESLMSGSNDVSIIIKGKETAGSASVSLVLNGTEYTDCVADLNWDDMGWDLSGSEHNKYSVNTKAPGYTAQVPVSTKLVAATATFTAIPEPSAFGLLAGLGAVALVVSRRRRK